MTSKKSEPFPAFTSSSTTTETITTEVMLRDDFAGQVLMGMVVNRIPVDDAMRASYAALAWAMADAMVKAR